eukprot:COSAG02_NODE_1070_length_14805_cov_3.364341_3_plen_52_part_00
MLYPPRLLDGCWVMAVSRSTGATYDTHTNETTYERATAQAPGGEEEEEEED